MAKKVAIFNQKGGVGKTTTAINLASALSSLGEKVLVCDIDSQANATSGLGFDKENIPLSIYDSLIEDKNISDVIQQTEYENLHLLPSNIELAGSEVDITNMVNRESILKNKIQEIDSKYNYILIDCPPSLGLLTINALNASDTVLIPIQCEYYALEGVGQLLNTINLVKNSLNPNLKIEGVLLTMDDSRTNLSNQVTAEVRNFFQNLVYDTTIPRNVRLAEAPSYGKPIFFYAKNSNGSKAYLKLAKEFKSKQRGKGVY